MKTLGFVLVLMACFVAMPPVRADRAELKEVSNFALLDQNGDMHELRRLNARAVVVFFTANGCPVARQSAATLDALRQKYEAAGVAFFLINASDGDDRASIVKEMAELKLPHLRVLKDDTQGVARHLAATRTAEAVAISTKDWSIFYRGALDDRVVEGAQKPEAAHHFLDDALSLHLSGKEVSVAKTAPRGCVITYDGGEGPDSAPVSYTKDVAPILAQKCVHCHSAGNIGSWNMSGHRKVKSMAGMIEEVILTRRMPPWDADPAHGKFRAVPALTVPEAQTLLRWVHQGAPRGEGDDLLQELAAKATPPPAWPLGKPDVVARMTEPEQIPATGVLDYRNIEVAVNNPQETWVGAVYIRPGNLKVVHHVIIRVKEGGARERAGLNTVFATWSPGITQIRFPENSGKYLPANAKLDFEIHYTTNGAPQVDQTEAGLYLLNEKPKLLYETFGVVNGAIAIPPGDPDSRAHAEYPLTKDVVLHSVKPHMHTRGKSMKFEMLYPNGKREIIASVPRFDFNWQLVYQLEQPKRIPAGSWILLTGSFDNSPRNPNNPNPRTTVYWGRQTFDEMFLGWFNITRPLEVTPSVAKATD